MTMADEASSEGGGSAESTQMKERVDSASSGDDGATVTDEQVAMAPPATSEPEAPDKQFGIDDDNDDFSNDDGMMEDQPLDDDAEGIEKFSVGSSPAESNSDKPVAKDNKDINAAVSKPMPLKPTPTPTVPNETLADGAATSSASGVAPPAPPPRLNKQKIPEAKSPKRPPQSKKIPDARVSKPKSSASATAQKSVPQSRKSPIEQQDSSDFGPFVEPIDTTEWNPFGDDDGLSPRVFHVDDDEASNSNNTKSDYERKSSGSEQTPAEELDSLRRVFDSEYERALEDQEISWRARYGATRLSFIMSALLMVVYLWLGCMFYRSEAGWSVPDALLFTVYTVTTVGYGGPQPLPNTAAFHAFTSMYVIVGISLVTVLGAHTYQLVTLEATRMRSSPLRSQQQTEEDAANDFGQEALTREMDKYRQQFMNELEDLVRERPLLDATLVKIKAFQTYLRTTKSGRVLGVLLPFLGMIFLGAIVVGTIEEWSPLESIYWSIVTLTTVGYGDYVPTKNSSVWFCTLFFIPSSLFFLSFLLANVAQTYIRIHAIHVTRLERKMRRNNEKRRTEAERAEKANRNAEAPTPNNTNPSSREQATPPASPGSSARAEDMEKGFRTTVISYMEDDDLDNSPTKSSGLFGDQAGIVDDGGNNDPLSSDSSPALRYRDNVIRNKDAAPDPTNGNRAVSFAEALQSLNQRSQSSQTSDDDQSVAESRGLNKPSLEVRLLVQARLARIIAEEVAGYQTGVIIKGSTVSLTIGSLRDTAEKWKISPQAWKAFRAVAFRSLLFVGERELISDGGDALLRLNVVEFHQIFSPMLAAMGDGSAMENWLAGTDTLADVELRGGARYGRGSKPIFNGTFT